MKLDVERPERVIDINRLPLDAIEDAPTAGLRIGATVRTPISRIIRWSCANYAVAVAGDPGRRVGPTPQHGDHGRQSAAAHALRVLPRHRHALQQARARLAAAPPSTAPTACWRSSARASPASRPTPPTCAWRCWRFEAIVHVQGTAGERDRSRSATSTCCPATRRTAKPCSSRAISSPHVTLPPPAAGEQFDYLKLRDRASYEFALVSAAVCRECRRRRDRTRACFALGGVGTKPWRAPEAERMLVGQAPSAALFRQAAEVALRERNPAEPERLQDRAGEALHRARRSRRPRADQSGSRDMSATRLR